MPIARQSTFTAGATLQADQLNDEFNHIVDAFDGSGNIALWVTYNNTDVAALRIDNSAAGKIASFLNNTTERVSIDSDGQITSLVATGTSPFEVSSTTVNTNLNADQVDGLDDTDLIRTAISPQTITKADTSIELTLTPTGNGADAGTASLYFDLRDAGTNVDAYWRVKGHGDDTFKIEQYDDGTTTWKTVLEFNRNGASPYTKVYNPTNDAMEQIATTKALTTVSIGAFFEGAVSTSAKQIRWVVPYNAETVTLNRGKFVYGGGSPSGTTTIKIEQFDVSGVSQASDTMDILSSHSVNVVGTDSGISFTLSGNDYLEITCTAAGAHEDLSVWFQGTQEIIT